MKVSPTFGLIRGEGNAFLFADAIRVVADAPKRTTLVHFHPQTELV